MRKLRSYGAASALTLFVVLSANPAAAQLGVPTPEQALIGRPSPFAGPVGTEPPSTDPRDFSGMWRSPPRPAGGPRAGGPGGPGGPGGAGGPGGPGGGAPGGFAAARPTSRYCIPGAMLLTGGEAGTDILQTPDELRIVTEEQHNNRRIYINQPHSVPLVRSLNGDSVAHWNGNTLVIETTGLIGYGVSPTLVRTERLSKSPGVRTQDILINLVEVKKENWSFGNGEAQYA